MLEMNFLCLVLIVNVIMESLALIKRSDDDEHGMNADRIQWNYDTHGPDSWPVLSGTECGRAYQSPIDIRDEYLKCDLNAIKPLQLYYQPMNFQIVHDGLNIISYPYYDKFPPEIDGSGLPNELAPYQLYQFHFHWGKTIYE